MEWVILHGGALGDLALTIQLALRLPGVGGDDGTGGVPPLHVVSRVYPGTLSTCRPPIVHMSSETIGLHWLFRSEAGIPPARLIGLVRGRRVLNALGAAVHDRLLMLGPAAAYSFDARPQPDVDRHIVDQWQAQLEAQGLLVPKCVHQRPGQRGLGVPDALRARGQTLLLRAGAGRATVLLHPGSGGRRKCWPTAGFVEVARRLAETGELQPCFLIGPVEVDTWPAEELTALETAQPTIRCPTPDELIALLVATRAFVGNDAGPSHLAALLGTPTVTIFGPTPAHVWHPLGPAARTLVGRPEVGADWGLSPAKVTTAVRQAATQRC